MTKSVIFLYCAFLALNLCGVVMLQDASQDMRSVCLLTDAPTQCGAFVHAALHPLFEHMENLRHHLQIQADGLQAITSRYQIQASAIDKLQADLNSKDVRLERMEESLQKLIRQDSEEKRSALESKIRTVQISLEGQLADILHTLRLSLNFKKIESRYFYFNDDIKKSWKDAEYFCVEKGGHLATFKNKEEFMAISAKVDPDVRYWLGVSDRARKGHFVYLDTGRRVSYLKWLPGEPDYWNDEMRCVAMYKGAMIVNECFLKRPVICQIGIEI
ncbi:hypothetical protein KR084_011089 [Drosophila pseudotakahashii]|nr:hypothetical protein KR084_011089 [Drosophila pseudotakahashii]